MINLVYVPLDLSWRINLQDLQSMRAKNMLDTLTHTSLQVPLFAMFVVFDRFETLLPVQSTSEKFSDVLLYSAAYQLA